MLGVPARERRVFGRACSVGDGFPLSETFEQPSFPRPTVIPAKAGIQGWGFPARNAGHLRHAVSRNGSYAKVSFRGNDGCWVCWRVHDRMCGGACAGTTDVGCLRVGDGFPPSETFEQPSFPRPAVIPAKAGIQGWGFPARICWASPPRCLPQRELRKGLLSRERRMWACLRVGDGFPPGRERRMFGGAAGLGMDSRLRGNDGMFAGACVVGPGFPPSETFEQPSFPLNNRHSRDQPSFPRRRESRAGGSLLGMLGISATLSPATGVTQRSPFACMTDVGVAACWGWVPACAGTTGVWGAAACWGWVPACAGMTGVWGGCVLGMGSRLRGNDGCWGRLRVGDGFPPARERRMLGVPARE